MQQSSFRPYSPEQAPKKKNKSQSQREYRSKEIDGFSELHNALLLADPFDAPLGKYATRPKLLVAAAKKLLNLAEENQKLALQLTAIPELCQPGTRSEMSMTQNCAVCDVAWATQAHNTGHAPLSDLVIQVEDFQSATLAWPQNSHPFYAHEHEQYDISMPPEPQHRYRQQFY